MGFKPGLGTLANLLIRSVTDDFAFAEREQIKVINRLHAQIVDEGHQAKRQDNALFERDFDVRDYQPIDVKVITPSIKPSSTRPKARWSFVLVRSGLHRRVDRPRLSGC